MRRAGSTSPPARTGAERAIRLACAALLLTGLAAFALSTVVRMATRERFVPLFDHWLYNALLLGAAIMAAWRPLRVRESRAAWSAIALGIALNAAGGLYTAFVLGGDADAPYPSPADALYLAFYPCAYLGLVLLARAQVRRLRLTLWLDGAIAVLGASAIVAAIVLDRVVHAASGRASAVVTTLAYPVCDTVLLCLVVTTASLCGWRLGRTWVAIAVGICLFAGADLVYALQSASDTYQEGTLLDVGWPAGFAVLAAAGWVRAGARRETRDRGLGGALAVPGLFTVSAIGLLATRAGGELATTLSVATLLASSLRIALAFRELQHLDEARRQALTDELTGLGNRRVLMRRLGEAVETAEPVALLVAGLDGFKEINDGLGHRSGDEALVASGERIAALLGPGDLLVRLTGDEFAVVLEGGEARACELAGLIAGALGERLEVAGIPVRMAASIGIVGSPRPGSDSSDLLRRADIAMSRAKRSGGGHELYEERAEEWSPQRLALVEQLRGAVRDRRLSVFYQPKELLETGEIKGAEALVRWRHPELGLLAPDRFLPLAEQSGLMHDLTICVLEGALTDLVAFRRRHPQLTVAVNVSIPTLLAADFPQEVRDLLERYALPPDALEIEITEDVLMADGPSARAMIASLRETGIAVSIDDYGTGYSSLNYLRDLSVDWLKLDRSLVTGIGEHIGAARIVESTIQLAHALGLRVIAEGVETGHDRHALSTFGCDAIQGYLLTPPIDAGAFSNWIDAWERGGWEEELAA